MTKIFPIFLICLQILNPSSPAVIRPKFQNIQDFQHCLVTYLNTIGIIQFTNSQNEENSAINCENFYIDLTSSIDNMYKLIRLNLFEALGDDGEAECMDEVFRYTKFMEYNVIATTAVQLQPNGFQELQNLLHISKNIFIYATMKCLISSDMIGELFQHFSTQIQVDDDQFACIVQHVSENQLMEDFIVKNIDEFLNEKFMESSEESQALAHNLHQNMQQVDKNSIYYSADTATDLIGTNFNEPTTTINSTHMTNLLDIPTSGSEIRNSIDDLNELELNYNGHVDNEGDSEVIQTKKLGVVDENVLETATETSKVPFSSTIESILKDLSTIDFNSIQSTQSTNVNDFSTTESILSHISTLIPEIISTKLKKIENSNDSKLKATETSTTDEYEANSSTISSNIESKPATDDDDIQQTISTMKHSVTESTENIKDKYSTTEASFETENFDQPPDYKVSTTEQFTADTSASIDVNLTPTASFLRSENFTNLNLTSTEDSSTINQENSRKSSNFSEKFGSYADNLKAVESTVMSPKKMMILERPIVSNIQKIEKSKKKKEKKSEEVTQNVTVGDENGNDNNASEHDGLMERPTVKYLNDNSDYSTESKETDDEDNYHQNKFEEMTKVAKDFMESDENVENNQTTSKIQENSTTQFSLSNFTADDLQFEDESSENDSKIDEKSSDYSQEVTEFSKNYENVSETSKASDEASMRPEATVNEEEMKIESELLEKSSEVTEGLENTETFMDDGKNDHESTTAAEIISTSDDQFQSSAGNEATEEYSDLGKNSTKSDDDQIEMHKLPKVEIVTVEQNDFITVEPENSQKASNSEENLKEIDNLNDKAEKGIHQNIEQDAEHTVDKKHQNPENIVSSDDKKGKIVFKITNLPNNLSIFTSKLLNKTKEIAEKDQILPDNSTKFDKSNQDLDGNNFKIDNSNQNSTNSRLNIDNNSNSTHNNHETTTNFEDYEENQQQSSEILQVSSENSFQKLANSLKDRKKSELKIPDSRIKRQTSKYCPSIIENLKLKIKKFNFESMDDELNSCMSQLVSSHDINDYFVFIVLKKYGSTDLQANEKNKKLMNMIMSFIGKYIECTDLYGFMEMAGFTQTDDGYF
ncbi:uncharacterized protein [Chironomus tepperi]|uniref:uncharacterized protein n=1 Tax=Chironomus tepperi TaxID=113505 RepID=UPI00391F17D5